MVLQDIVAIVIGIIAFVLIPKPSRDEKERLLKEIKKIPGLLGVRKK